jgi:malate dehydrogenase
MRPKVSIIGAGATGATMAQRLVEKNLCDVVMLDIPERENPTKGKALDMLQAVDSARWRTFIAMELGVSAEDVQGLVLGGHTDVGMVPLPRYSSVAGIPLTDLLDSERIAKLIDRARKGGTEIVQLLGEGSAYYAPSAAVITMIESILLDKKRIIPSSVLLQGEYGLKDIFLGVPVVLGARGAERIIELKLTPEELAQLQRAAEIVRETVSKVQV